MRNVILLRDAPLRSMSRWPFLQHAIRERVRGFGKFLPRNVTVVVGTERTEYDLIERGTMTCGIPADETPKGCKSCEVGAK